MQREQVLEVAGAGDAGLVVAGAWLDGLDLVGELAVQEPRGVWADGAQARGRGRPLLGVQTPLRGYREKDSPQPQVFVAWGFWNTKPLPLRPPWWSSVMPPR